MINTPVITFEVEYMKHTIMIALCEYSQQLNDTLKHAVEEYCTPENLQSVIDSEVRRVLDAVIKEEVKHWFVYGDGRKAIREAVQKKLSENTTYTPLDDLS